MPWRDWFGGARRPRFDGTTGRPTSSNGASSFHLFWEVGGGPWTAAEAVLEVVDPPTVPELHFWALQVSFTGGGRGGGGAHLGLQWFPIHPGSTAVNWGGYAAGGGELAETLPCPRPRNLCVAIEVAHAFEHGDLGRAQ